VLRVPDPSVLAEMALTGGGVPMDLIGHHIGITEGFDSAGIAICLAGYVLLHIDPGTSVGVAILAAGDHFPDRTVIVIALLVVEFPASRFVIGIARRQIVYGTTAINRGYIHCFRCSRTVHLKVMGY